MKNNLIRDCKIIELETMRIEGGSLSIFNQNNNFPFEVKRVFYIYDIPGGADRGAHAHKECHQLLVATSGSFDIDIDDGINTHTYILNRPYYGLHIPPGIWAAEKRFSSGAICLVMASELFNSDDYMRDYNEFKNYKGL